LATTIIGIVMLLSDAVYKRVPMYWMLVGILFLLLGLSAGPEVRFFFAYIGFGVLGIGRSVWIYLARWNVHQKNRFSVARTPTVVHRDRTDGPSGKA